MTVVKWSDFYTSADCYVKTRKGPTVTGLQSVPFDKVVCVLLDVHINYTCTNSVRTGAGGFKCFQKKTLKDNCILRNACKTHLQINVR